MPSTSKGLTPNGESFGKMSKPLDSSLMPSSTSEHNMPSESMPRIPRRAMSMPFGILVPRVAKGTTSPGCIFVAPHHTWRSSPSPASTKQRVTFAASGCFSMRLMRAVTTPGTGVPTTSISSTARPREVSATATTSGSDGISAISRRIERRIFMRTAP